MLNKTTIKFIIVGIITTLIHYAVLSVCFERLGISILISTLVAFSFAVLFSYLANYFFTFDSSEQHHKSLPKFCVTVLVGLLINMLVMHFAVTVGELDYRLAFVIATSLVMVNNFTLSKLWVF